MAVKTEPQVVVADPVQRDATRLRTEDFPYCELPALNRAREPRYQIAIRQSVMDDIRAHGKETLDVEICGILLGTVYHDSRGPWCLIDANVRGNFSAGKQTAVTITSETWTHVNEVRDRLHPDKKFIGWYHTHPGFGIFLSGMDDFIQQNFFSEPWQVALVYDPKSGEEGVFIWRDGKTANEPFLIVPEDGASASVAGAPQETETSDKLPSGTLGELMSRLQAAEQRQRWMLFGLGIVGLLAVIWPLVVFLFLGETLSKLQQQAPDTTGSAQTPAQTTGDSAVHNPSTLPTAVHPPTAVRPPTVHNP
jgi:proteasome lid subunit RPN8/RPN11